MRNDPNIRSPEERYGGEGHAGSDPYAGERVGHKDLSPDPAVEVPDADLEDLIEQPEPPGDQEQKNDKTASSRDRTNAATS